KMTGAPALLLLLALGLCEYGHYGAAITQPRMGQKLTLHCESSNMDSGVFWVRQDKAGTLHFIVFISSLPRTTFGGNMRTSTRFEAGKDSRFYRLAVKSFKPQDEGNYFCLMNINQALYFSPGQPVFLPALPKCPAPPVPACCNQSPLPQTPLSVLACPRQFITSAARAPCLPSCGQKQRCWGRHSIASPHPLFSIPFMALKG
uniref:Ig-like domain-containing protein n=1 Tax=Amazona collaria TaxID=241587 RepID=A0A8B9FEE4_9PSIT